MHLATLGLTLAVLAGALVPADAATRCRSHKLGSTTYSVCESKSEKTECRSIGSVLAPTKAADER